MKFVRALLLLCCVLAACRVRPVAAAAAAEDWIEPMRNVHARFTGTKGTFAQFGDSITVTMAFWTPLQGAEIASVHARVKTYLKPECWGKWKGPAFGNNGSMTIRWAHENVGAWLTKSSSTMPCSPADQNDGFPL